MSLMPSICPTPILCSFQRGGSLRGKARSGSPECFAAAAREHRLRTSRVAESHLDVRMSIDEAGNNRPTADVERVRLASPAFTSLIDPTCEMRPLLTRTASAVGCDGSIVSTRPFKIARFPPAARGRSA